MCMVHTCITGGRFISFLIQSGGFILKSLFGFEQKAETVGILLINGLQIFGAA